MSVQENKGDEKDGKANTLPQNTPVWEIWVAQPSCPVKDRRLRRACGVLDRAFRLCYVAAKRWLNHLCQSQRIGRSGIMGSDIQRSEMVAHLAVIDAEELVGSGGHVDVVRLPFSTLTVKKLVDRFVGWGQLQEHTHQVEQRLAQVRGSALGGSVAPAILRSGLVGHWINARKGSQRPLALEAVEVTNLSHELWTNGFPNGIHAHDYRVFRQFRGQTVHLSAENFRHAGKVQKLGCGLLNQQL